jgi:chromate transporter
MFDVFWVFLRLGLTSFGGPVAHLAYFRQKFVDELRWVSAQDYGALLALCQFLPGPASSQAGFSIGLLRAGWRGGLAAWVGFTLPSAVIMACIAAFAGVSGPVHAVLHGLQLAAVAVVAQAVWVMFRGFCPAFWSRALAAAAMMVVFCVPGSWGQIFVILAGAVAGRFLVRAPVLAVADENFRAVSRRAGLVCLAAFFGLLGLAFLPVNGLAGLGAAFYRSGALVFGGGHVVLPLLRDAVVGPGWLSPKLFLAGYGAAQAMPGPLFTVASFLGFAVAGPIGAAVAIIGIFLPGLLIVAGALPFWQSLRARPGLASALQGVNAAVVGLLAAAWLGLIRYGAIQNFWDVPVVVVASAVLLAGRAKPLTVVAACAVLGLVF